MKRLKIHGKRKETKPIFEIRCAGLAFCSVCRRSVKISLSDHGVLLMNVTHCGPQHNLAQVAIPMLYRCTAKVTRNIQPNYNGIAPFISNADTRIGEKCMNNTSTTTVTTIVTSNTTLRALLQDFHPKTGHHHCLPRNRSSRKDDRLSWQVTQDWSNVVSTD
jgi:hypothetical protein